MSFGERRAPPPKAEAAARKPSIRPSIAASLLSISTTLSANCSNFRLWLVNSLLEQDRLFDRIQGVADSRSHAVPLNPAEMRKRCVERRVGAVELGKGARMKLFENIDKAAQLRLRRFAGGLIIERGPPDEFGHRNFARQGRPFLRTRALSFAVIGTTSLCVARLIAIS